MRVFSAALFGGLAVALASRVAAAEILTIGVSQETTSAYPNYWVTTPNQKIAAHMFNNLVEMNHQNRPTPGFAESWKPLDDKIWEFKLRKGVKSYDWRAAPHGAALFLFGRSFRPRAENVLHGPAQTDARGVRVGQQLSQRLRATRKTRHGIFKQAPTPVVTD